MHRTALLLAAILSSACAKSTVSAAGSASREGQIPVSFLSIVVNAETTVADERLKRFLEKAVAGDLETAQGAPRFDQRAMAYGDLIRALAEPDRSRGYLARITPYAYVAAEMIGAKLTVLAVYRSTATKSTTYQSYFVVRKDALTKRSSWRQGTSEPSLNDVVSYLKHFTPERATFAYHDRFSTSSYFLPSLFFKAHGVVAMGQSPNGRLTPISVEHIVAASSSELVRLVKAGRADIAAVWDDTKGKFQSDSDLVFIANPAVVPNDFLVAWGIGEANENRIIKALREDPAANRPCSDIAPTPARAPDGGSMRHKGCAEIAPAERPKDDFDSWHVWNSHDSGVTDAAQEALARLRQDAKPEPVPVVVKVQRGATGADPDADELLKTYEAAAREAVRLSGTELVLLDPDLHKRVDMIWTVASAHDGALTLTTELDGFKGSEETFSVSFVSGADLPRRLSDLARSRLRRIRYLWPYEQKYPVVLRDLDFTPDRRVQVQRIRWIDPARHEYEEDTPFAATIEDNTDFNKFRLSNEIAFPKGPDGSFNFDPMSTVAYRVVLAREPHPSWIWAGLASSSSGLLVLACAGLVVDLRRRQPPARGLRRTYERLVEAYHQPWLGRQVEEGAILLCDARSLDELVKEPKTTGALLDLVKTGGLDFNVGPIPVRLSLLMKLGSSALRRGAQLSSDLVESAGGGSVAALDMLLQFLVRQRRLAPFVGCPGGEADRSTPLAWPMEWQALNEMTALHFQDLGVCDRRADTSVDCGGAMFAQVVAAHFRAVLKRATREASLFRQRWRVDDALLTYETEIRTPLKLGGGSWPITKVRIEVALPATRAVALAQGESSLDAWVLGKMLNWSSEGGVLSLYMKPIAVLRDLA